MDLDLPDDRFQVIKLQHSVVIKLDRSVCCQDQPVELLIREQTN